MDRFLRGWILNITPPNSFPFFYRETIVFNFTRKTLMLTRINWTFNVKSVVLQPMLKDIYNHI